MVRHSLKHRVKKVPSHEHLIGKYSFSNLQLFIFILAFAAVGYLIFRSFAATGSLSKTWDSQADFQAGSLSNTVANADGTVTLQTAGAVPTGQAVNPPSTVNMDFETGNYNQFEVGVVGGNPETDNYPYGDVVDNNFKIGGGQRVAIVSAATDPTHVRRGNYAARISVQPGDGAAFNITDREANWIRNFESNSSTYSSTSNYKPGQSRASQLPGDNDIIGREVYWGMSLMVDPSTTVPGGNAVGVDFHSGGNCIGSNSNLTLYQDRWEFLARGSNPLGSCNRPGTTPCCAFDQTVVAFNDDGTFFKTNELNGGGNIIDPAQNPGWKTATKGVWYDFVFHIVWSGDPNVGRLQIWMQKNKSGVYTEVVPLTHISISYSYKDSSGAIKAAEIEPNFGFYRYNSTATWTGWWDEIKRGKNFSEVMIPGSTVAGSTGSGYLPSGSITLNHDAGQTVDWASATPVLSSQPTGTNVTYQYRTTNTDNTNWSAWTPDITTLANGRYLQAQANLSTTNSTVTPSLDKLTVTYDPVPPPTAPPSLFGTSAIGGFLSGFSNDSTLVNKYSVSSDVRVTKLSMYLDGLGGATGSQNLKGVIYSDNGGQPASLIAASNELQITSGSAGDWRDLPFSSPVTLKAGTYWIGAIVGGTAGVARDATTTVTGAMRYSSDLYSDGPAAIFTNPGTADALISLVAVGSTSTPPPPDTTAPTTPTNLHSTATTTSSISLAWAASTDTGGSGLSGYKLYRNGTFLQQTTNLSFTDTGLTASTSYAYKISAIDNSSNESAQSAAVSVATTSSSPAPTAKPTIPTGLQATPGDSSVSLKWNANPSTDQVDGFQVYRNDVLVKDSITGLSYIDPGLTNGTTYNYRISAHNSLGYGDWTSPVPATPTAAAPPPPSSNPDLNGDGKVDIFDLSILLSHYGQSGTGDIDNNGIVDIFDLSKLLAQYKG
jgi:hypothetical protein